MALGERVCGVSLLIASTRQHTQGWCSHDTPAAHCLAGEETEKYSDTVIQEHTDFPNKTKSVYQIELRRAQDIVCYQGRPVA